MKNSVVVNGRFVTQTLTGVQRYAYEIVKRNRQAMLIAPAQPRTEYKDIGSGVVVRDFVIGKHPLGGHLWEQFCIPFCVRKNLLLWSPCGSGPLAVKNQVLTIHDISHIDHPEWYDRLYSTWHKFLLPKLVKRVKLILTSSNFTKQRLISTLEVPEQKIMVVPGGVAPQFRILPNSSIQKTLRKFGLDGEYILTVGATSLRKNFARLCQSWQSLESELESVSLVVVGHTQLRFANTKFMHQAKRVRFLTNVSDEELVALYNGALAFVYPSLYEGFGLPVLEAMACGTPVVASNQTSLPEVVDDAAILVDPISVDSITQGIKCMLSNIQLRSVLRQKGLARAQHFKWDKTAESTWRVLQLFQGDL